MVSKSADPLTRNRGFESGSLQRGVTCEPDFRSVEVGRIGTAMAPCARHRHPSSPLTHTTAGHLFRAAQGCPYRLGCDSEPLW